MAHLAVTDVEAGRFHARDRWARGALDLAGAAGDPLRVWLGDWAAEAPRPRTEWPLRLRAGEGDLRIDLTLAAGSRRCSTASAGSRGRAPSRGTRPTTTRSRGCRSRARCAPDGRALPGRGPRVDGPRVEHERAWPRPGGLGLVRAPARRRPRAHALPPPPARRRESPRRARAPSSRRTAAARALDRDAVEVLVLDHWTSPRGGTRYPARWRLRIPSASLDVVVTPLLRGPGARPGGPLLGGRGARGGDRRRAPARRRRVRRAGRIRRARPEGRTEAVRQ